MTFPRIWVFPGNRSGDDGQVYALAEELGLPFETRPMQYNFRYRLPGTHKSIGAHMIENNIRAENLVPPWPDLILIAGKHPAPVARWVRERSGGRTRLVFLGHPRVAAESFDIIYTTRSYLAPESQSVRLLPVSLSRYRSSPKFTQQEKAWLDSLPRPHLLLMLGGKTRHWRMRPAFIAERAVELAARAASAGGSLIVVRSARTPDAAIDAIERRLEVARCEWRVVRGPLPRFSVLLDDADELFPTFDSVSMISESVITGKPTGIVPAEMNWFGRLVLGPEVRSDNRKRDLRRFANHLIENDLAGMMDRPIAARIPNPAVAAALEVRQLLQANLGKEYR